MRPKGRASEGSWNPLDPISGLLHPQTDVFYQQVKAP